MSQAPPEPAPTPEERRAAHAVPRENAVAEAKALGATAQKLAMARLGVFLAMVVVGAAGFSQGSLPLLCGAGGLVLFFAALVVGHLRVLTKMQVAEARASVHERHLHRIDGNLAELAPSGTGQVPVGHPYAGDLDLVGSGSLMQRIDVTRTKDGEATLARWLLRPATVEVIAARHAAVKELAWDVELREQLETAARLVAGKDKLDPTPFLAFTKRPNWIAPKVWALVIIHVLPVLVLGLFVADKMHMAPSYGWGIAAAVTSVIALSTSRYAYDAFDLVAARRGYVEAFVRMLKIVEGADFEAPLSKELVERTKIDGRPATEVLAELDRWAGFAEFRTQFPVHFFVNLVTLWDLHVLYRLEKWNARSGGELAEVFTALGELEALASLASLAHNDADATYPEIAAPGTPFEADGLAHPLLTPTERVANDVRLRGPGSALIVTGSNMAGKSTLLRSVGLNVALALAGGPVIARRLSVPRVRLRASMRIDDSLQEGASYFHAELTRLRIVVHDADEQPPLLFLLDELLRGTNARARHLGARAVLTHLLERGGTGLSATHDIALARLEDEQPDLVHNVHFTDVMQDGEMRFDYQLRQGVVKTSNALRLLAMAGIDVPDDDSPGNPDDLPGG